MSVTFERLNLITLGINHSSQGCSQGSQLIIKSRHLNITHIIVSSCELSDSFCTMDANSLVNFIAYARTVSVSFVLLHPDPWVLIDH